MKPSQRIYQIYCGRWEEANILDHPGKVLSRLIDFDWKGLKQRLGLTHIYLLGLWEVGDKIIVMEEEGKDLRQMDHRCPSAFAIVDHTSVSQKLGTDQDLSALIRKIHQAGMGVYVDWVGNHTGFEHPWYKKHPEWYKPGVAFSGDVAELNYAHPMVVKAMLEAAVAITRFKMDGFRCDMAHLVPTDFWETLIIQLRKLNPEFRFIAEVYEQSVFEHQNADGLLTAGFDAVYDWVLYSNLKQYAGTGDSGFFDSHLAYLKSVKDDRLVHYLSNHDDPFPLQSDKFWPLLHLVSQLPGSLLVYNGSDSGFVRRLAHHYVEIMPKKYVDGSGQVDRL